MSKMYLVTVPVLRARGSQTWLIEAENKNAALVKYAAGDGDVVGEEYEPDELGKPSVREREAGIDPDRVMKGCLNGQVEY
jgi:hypothetical protein